MSFNKQIIQISIGNKQSQLNFALVNSILLIDLVSIVYNFIGIFKFFAVVKDRINSNVQNKIKKPQQQKKSPGLLIEIEKYLKIDNNCRSA